MKKKLAFIFTILCFWISPSFGATYIAEPVLISQPEYFGNSFYMYRPSNTPAGSLIQISPTEEMMPQNFVHPSASPSFVTKPENPAVFLQGTTPFQGPRWMINKNFMMVSAWKGLIDRMGILHRPKLPIAWQGETPKAIFVWTGKSWWQIHCKTGETPQCALQRNMYALTKLSKENQESWTSQDAGFLANQASLWGYYWMGYILPECR